MRIFGTVGFHQKNFNGSLKRRIYPLIEKPECSTIIFIRWYIPDSPKIKPLITGNNSFGVKLLHVFIIIVLMTARHYHPCQQFSRHTDGTAIEFIKKKHVKSSTTVFFIYSHSGVHAFIRILFFSIMTLFEFIRLHYEEVDIELILTARSHFFYELTLLLKKPDTLVRHIFRYTYPVIEV